MMEHKETLFLEGSHEKVGKGGVSSQPGYTDYAMAGERRGHL